MYMGGWGRQGVGYLERKIEKVIERIAMVVVYIHVHAAMGRGDKVSAN